MSWYGKKKSPDYYDDLDREIVKPPKPGGPTNMFIDAWQFDGDMLDLGYTCQRLHRRRLSDIVGVELLRWRVLGYIERRVNPRYVASIAWLRRLGEAFFTNETGHTIHFQPHSEGYTKGVVRTDTKLPPLMQLAEIPDITEEHLACGKEILDVDKWSLTWLRRRKCLDAALLTAFYANERIRERVDEVGRGRITVNGRVYLVRAHWLSTPSVGESWPEPGDATFTIGT